MNGRTFDFEKIVKDLNIDDGPKGNHKACTKQEMLRAFHNANETEETDGFHQTGSRIMQSTMIKYAAVIGIVVAIGLGIHFMGQTGGVVWAEVVARVGEVRTFVYNHRIVITQDQEKTPVTSRVYGNTALGWYFEQTIGENTKVRKYISSAEKAVIEIIPKMKKYSRGRMSAEQMAESLRLSDPRELVKTFMSLEYYELERKEIRGVTVEGIEITDPKLGAGAFDTCTGRLWVSVESNLPVRIELEGQAANNTTLTEIIASDFEWNVALENDLFVPKIPKGYEALADISISDRDEGILIKGLRNFSELMGGTYPSQLAVMTANQEVRKGLLSQRLEAGAPLDTMPTRAEIEKAVSVQASCLFYARLVKEDMEGVYYGDTVTAEFPEAVLLRWRVRDGFYRVVFGDLHLETVSTEVLAELEAMPLNTDAQAIKPQPMDGAMVNPNEALRLNWLPGAEAVEHRLYLGTNPEAMSLLVSQQIVAHDMTDLQADTVYYWRVDEVSVEDTVVTGQTWSLRTGTLVGHWPLDDGQGSTAADASGYERHGILYGDPTWHASRGVVFDGLDDYVEISEDSVPTLDGPTTLACWIRVNRFDKDWQAILTKGDTAWRLSRDQGDTLHFACTGLAPQWVHGKTDVNDGQWHHVAGTFNGEILCLYIDGRLDISAPTVGTPKTNDQPIRIGDNAEEAGRQWNGAIAEVRLYNYGLSGDEIQGLYEESAGSFKD